MTTVPAAASKCCQVIEDGNEQDDDENEEEEDDDDEEQQLRQSSRPVASKRRITTATIEGITTNNPSAGQVKEEGQPNKYSQFELLADSTDQLTELKDKLLCDIRLAGPGKSSNEKRIATDCCNKKSIDSRSILINKERLKKFWESRMEMEFKLRQQQEPNLKSGKDKSNTSAGAKLADENNNNNNGKECDEQQQQVVNLSDEEWRSLSPLVPPSGGQQTKPVEKQEEEEEEVPNEISLVDENSSQRQELQQPMSIDPTLCHPQSSSDSRRQRAAILDGPENEFVVLDSGSGGLIIVRNEEQTINEEFSSATSSSASFGPMSISLNQQQQQQQQNQVDDQEEEEEEEPNDSTDLSGSVSTVITRAEHHQKLDELNDDDGDDYDETSSNIGVAFESLHFDNEIRSSKEEKVDEHLLLVGSNSTTPTLSPLGPQQKQQQQASNRFSAAKEVRSVCSFITAAISDASRQVESFYQGSSNSQTICSSHIIAEGEQQDDLKLIRGASAVERATFVEATPQLDNELVGAEPGIDVAPKATDLSSIFDANVRREIQRFEKQSALSSSNLSRSSMSSGGSKLSSASSISALNGCGQSNSNKGLTEWRIAEEIRLFNEREMELKRRLVANNNNNSSSSLKKLAKADECQGGESQVVRFGKTLRIPKSIGGNGSSSEVYQDNQFVARANSGIKLSSSLAPGATQQQQQPAISMHKFIASGGKRFVLTSPTQQQPPHHLSKSMSSLSMGSASSSASSSSQAATQHHKPADYKAVDSLRCKETPNVEPGMARKVIESFSRLRGQSNCTETGSRLTSSSMQLAQPQSQLFAGSQSSNRRLSTTLKGQQQQQVNATTVVAPTANNNTSSAEWKIQEELREMRAREAELRSQQRQQQFVRMQQQADDTNRQQPGERRQLDERRKSSPTNMDEPMQVRHISTAAAKTDRPFSLSSESLYPIKQTIDSFRRLNNSPPQQTNGVPTMRQHDDDDDNDNDNDDDNYDSKVGGQRRKIALIERWECKKNVC